jgi:hypothetical protein
MSVRMVVRLIVIAMTTLVMVIMGMPVIIVVGMTRSRFQRCVGMPGETGGFLGLVHAGSDAG